MQDNPYATPSTRNVEPSQFGRQPNQVRIRRFSVLQMGKILGTLYGFLAVVILPFAMIAAAGGNTELFILVIVYPIAGFIGGIIGAALYNLAASLVGGMEMELTAEVES